MNYIDALRTHSVAACDRLLQRERRYKLLGLGICIASGLVMGYLIVHVVMAVVNSL